MTWGRLLVENHRGERVPASLGLVLIGPGAAAGALAAWAVAGEPATGSWVGGLGSLLVLGAGLVDDLAPPGPRGLRGHLRALAEGRVTTGVVKAFVIGAASVVTVAAWPAASPLVRALGAVLLAASANLWNGLDVRPGRALKAFLVVGGVAVAADPGVLRAAPTVAGALAASLPALALDLRERAMLGDAGANLLGFTAGLALYAALPPAGVAAAAAGAVALNLVAETATLSRLIDAVPPLRWADRLGRRDDR